MFPSELLQVPIQSLDNYKLFLHFIYKEHRKGRGRGSGRGKRLGVVIKDRAKETQNPGLDLKEEIRHSIFGFLSMVLKMCKYDLKVNNNYYYIFNASFLRKLQIITDFHVAFCICFKSCSVMFSKPLVLTKKMKQNGRKS